MGNVALVAMNLALLLSLIFWGFNLNTNRVWEAIAVRAGWMTLAQLPLVFLMAGKANIVGMVTGSSYERLNWLHRAAARCMLFTSMLHMGYFLRSWARYEYITRKFAIDEHARTGISAFSVLAWMVVSSIAPIRGLRYEIFFLQHMVSGIGFLVAVWYHVPEEAQGYVYVPVALWALDRVVRTLFTLYNSLTIFHRRADANAEKSAIKTTLTARATFEPLPGRATRITVHNPPFTWSPGQHAFISIHSLARLQSHPFTITSIPSDNKLEFIVRAHNGGTHLIHEHACACLPTTEAPDTRSVFIDGPYGRLRPLEQFDSVTLIAASTGASFTLPLLRDLIYRRTTALPVITRRIRFIWVIRSRAQASWFAADLAAAIDAAATAGVQLDASVYITCDDFTPQTCGTEPGACCCANEVDEDEIISPCTCGPSAAEQGKLAGGIMPITGRPAIRAVLKKEMEMQRGEGAVVVCGPRGMVDSVKAEVVGLCDERAVCKGSGAQGVYVHAEAFAW